MWPFKCRHPFSGLVPQTGRVEVTGKDADFTEKRLVLHCYGCGADLSLRWANMIGGVDAFLARGGDPSTKPRT